MEDVRYVWKVPDPVQFAPNLFLPGGFDLADHQGGYCDVQTATGALLNQIKLKMF